MSKFSDLEHELSVERERVAKLKAALRDIRKCAAGIMPQHSSRADLQAKIVLMNQPAWTRLAAILWGAEDALNPDILDDPDQGLYMAFDPKQTVKPTLVEWVDQNVDRNNTHQIAVYTALRNFAVQLDRLGVGK